MSLRLTILGSGTAIPDHDRFPAGYLVETDDHTTLVDLGPGVLRRLAAVLGRDALARIDTVLLTHYHTDHCADLAALLFGLRNPRFENRRPLVIRGAPGLRALVDAISSDTAWPWLRPRGYELRLEEIEPGRLPLGEAATVDAVPIRHTAQSLGYRIAASGRSLALSGDADACDELVELARGVDFFVCDAAFPDEARTEGHLTPGLAGEHAQRAGARTLCLTHFYPECDGVDLIAQARATFGGHVVLAEDLAVHEIG
jgi:ribonuclease BN (tRNA processing enzyme)